LSAASRARYVRNEFTAAARLQYDAADTFQQCLDQRPHERTLSSEQRLGEMWMLSGELERNAGEAQIAKTSLLRAKEVFSRLRLSVAPHGAEFDVVLLEAHQVDDELAKLQGVRR
jgi:hypothetical protein